MVERVLSRLPPFWLVVLDTAMMFTLEYPTHPHRRTTFAQALAQLGLRHWRIPRGKPWRNGFIERSNRTDNAACFHQQRFASSEERQYIHRLWEMRYNPTRPHQGLNGQTPLAVLQRDYAQYANVQVLR